MVNIRQKVSNAYPHKSWRNKVKNMSDGQVYAIYARLVKDKIV